MAQKQYAFNSLICHSINRINIAQCISFKVRSYEPSAVAITAGAYPSFCSMKQLGVLLLLLDEMLVHRR